MGELFKIDFNKKRDKNSGSNSESVSDEEIERVDGSGGELRRNVAKDKEFLNRVTETFVFVNSLLKPDPMRVERVARQRKVVANYTDMELVGWIDENSEGDWKDKPFFFFAVCSEIKNRLDKFFYDNKKQLK